MSSIRFRLTKLGGIVTKLCCEVCSVLAFQVPRAAGYELVASVWVGEEFVPKAKDMAAMTPRAMSFIYRLHETRSKVKLDYY